MHTKRLAVVALTALAGCYAASDRYIVFNAPPAVAILLPAEDTVFEEDEGIVFQGRVSDNQPVDTLQIQWISSIDGPLDFFDVPDPDGYLELATAGLSIGDHVITLRATDDDADQGEARVTIHVEGVPDDPTIEVLQPQNNGQGLEGFPYEFMVRVDDHQTAPQDLIVDVVSDPGGDLCIMVPDTNGIATCSEQLANDTYLLTFTVTDTDGFTASRNVVFEMVSEGDYDGDGDGFTPNDGDCNDNLAQVYPGAPEICDGIDNDCIAGTMIDVGTDCYDDDADNFCESPPCINASGTLSDCNDAKNWVYPGATEQLNGTDDDCDGLTDEGTSKYDDDGDGFCESPPCINATGAQSDCNDGNAQVRPNATESCATEYDDDCDGNTNEQNAISSVRFYKDVDNDGYYPSANSNNYEYWCFPMGEYSGTTGGDCYDSNALAHPFPAGQNSPFYTNGRGDTGPLRFDYNCNGSSEQEYPTPSTCVLNTSGWPWDWECHNTGGGGVGWTGTVPACGASGMFVDECSYDWASCGVICGVTCSLALAEVIPFSDCTTCAATQCLGQGTCDPDAPSYEVQACR